MFKKSLLLFYFLILVEVLFGQTYFGFGIGGDLSLIKQAEFHKTTNPGNLYLTNKEYLTKSISIEMMIEQQLSAKSYLSLNGTWFSRRGALAHFVDPVLVLPESIGLNTLQIKILFRQNIFKRIHVGSGLGVSFHSVKLVYPKVTEIIEDLSYWYPNNVAYESYFVMGYNYKHLLLELYFQKGLGFKEDYSYFIKPIDSFGITLNYLFRLSKKRNGDKGRF